MGAFGSRNPQMLWDYGRMSGGSHPAQAERALTTLLADQPNRIDVRLVLGQIQMSNKQAKDAIETLGLIKKITPADAPRLFQILAFANTQVSKPRGCPRQRAALARKIRKTPTEKDQRRTAPSLS